VRETLIEKMDRWKATQGPIIGYDPQHGTRHDDLLRYFDKMATDLQLTEAERIAYEDLFS